MLLLTNVMIHTGNTPLIPIGSIWPSSGCDCTWCRVLEFTEAFGILVTYEPLVSAER